MFLGYGALGGSESVCGPLSKKKKNTISCTHRILHTNSEEKRKENRFLDTLDLYLRSQRRDFFWELGDEKLKPMV